MSLLESMRRSLFEDEEKKEKPVETKPEMEKPSAPVIPISAEASEDEYQRVLESTRFETTDVGKIVHKYVQAMEGTNLGEAMTLKTAITQAKRLDGLSDDDVMESFAHMKVALEAERTNFEKIVEETKTDEVTSREEDLKKLTEEYNQTQQKLVQLQAETSKVTTQLSEWQGRIARAQSQFSSAVQRRSAEIESERIKMSTLLGGNIHG